MQASDLCNANEPPPIRTPRDVAGEEYDECFQEDSEELTLIGTSGYKVTKIGGLENLTKLKTLILRSHLIDKMEGLDTFTELEKLELYDNQIGALKSLGAFAITLKVLDISFNVIRSMEPISHLENLVELFIANNKINQIQGLEGCVNLKVLDIGSNRIREIEGLGNCVELVDLWMGKNKITEIKNLENLTKIRRLDIQSNRLTSITNLGSQASTLTELYLASNGINDSGLVNETGISGLEWPLLNTIDLSKNRITKLAPFKNLPAIEELWISENGVGGFEEVEELSAVATLQTIYLEHNPLSKDFEYRKKLKFIIPSLTQIDANMIRPGEVEGIMGGGGMASMTDGQRRGVIFLC